MGESAAPSRIDDPSGWTASDLGGARRWVYRFDEAMVAEVAEAVHNARARGLKRHELGPHALALPHTAPMLTAAYEDLENGRAFAVLAGWPVEEFSYDENVDAYFAVASHLGRVVVQNYEGDLVVDVRDEGKPYSHRSRGYHSNSLLPFHTDGAHSVGLLCLGTPAEGGKSVIASATTVYNTVLAERPDLMDILMRGYFHHRRGQHAAGENPLSPERIPVFAFHAGTLHCCYNRNPIEWCEKEGVTLSAAEREALDYLDAVVARPGMSLAMDLAKGDMQFLNNFVILHSRTGYRDGPDERRHLVRLWLDNPKSRRNGPTLLDLYVPAERRYAARG